jgi:hypothetical protein
MNNSMLKRRQFAMPFNSVRNISSPEDLSNDRKVYSGHAPLNAIVDISTDENVRSYLLEAEGRQRRRPTSVHKAIAETLRNSPHNFSVLNSGVTIVAKDIEVDDKAKVLKLVKPSIINGAQTQGVIKDLIDKGLLDGSGTHIKFEIIVTTDEDLIAEISIARNYQNDVMTISIAGRRGQLDELEESIQKSIPDIHLRKSETELPSEDYIDTEKLIQVILALMPSELWFKPGEENPNKVYTYSAKAKCLKDFQEIYKRAKDKTDPEHEHYKAVYKYSLDIAPQAYELYLKWKSHQGFKGTRLRSIEREAGEIVDVPDGIIFPILSALSVFAIKSPKGWKIAPPSFFKDEELIKIAKSTLIEIADHNPQTMGKSRACYSALLQITSIYKHLSTVGK